MEKFLENLMPEVLIASATSAAGGLYLFGATFGSDVVNGVSDICYVVKNWWDSWEMKWPSDLLSVDCFGEKNHNDEDTAVRGSVEQSVVRFAGDAENTSNNAPVV